jgi:murein DD-endopeptidase MepM/ murein hydrolase activator NlpD
LIVRVRRGDEGPEPTGFLPVDEPRRSRRERREAERERRAAELDAEHAARAERERAERADYERAKAERGAAERDAARPGPGSLALRERGLEAPPATTERSSDLAAADGSEAARSAAGDSAFDRAVVDRPAFDRPARASLAARLGSRLGFVLWLAFIAFGLALTPRAVGDLLEHDELPAARLTRERIGHRLTSLRDRLLALAEDVGEEGWRVEKIRIAYGLPPAPPPPSEGAVDPDAFPSSVYRSQIEETATLATRVRLEVVDLEARVAALRAFELLSPELAALTPALSPLRGEFVMTSAFGYRKSAFTDAEEYHSGVDLAAAVGTPVVAAADGRVVFVGRLPVSRDSTWWRLGDVVAVRHGEDLLTLYGHLGAIVVRRGQSVARGDRLAAIGESGVLANPHLHYAVWRSVPGGDFQPVDPRLLMLDRKWDDEEKLLAGAELGADAGAYEPLPRRMR